MFILFYRLFKFFPEEKRSRLNAEKLGFIRSKRIDKGVSTFDDLLVHIPCNSLFSNGLEDAIYSLSTYGRIIIMPMVVSHLIALIKASGVGSFGRKTPIFAPVTHTPY